jgi:ribulose-phosphate 3-epimerase
MDHLVSPSLLAADFGNLEKDVEMVNNSLADWLHLDIMDGVFVPNISFGFPVLEYVKRVAAKPLDVHLMIIDPDRYLTRFRDAGANILTVQYEACTHLNRTLNEIRNLGMKAGVALNPHTPVSLLKNTLPFIDMVLIMTVNPGFGGQSFILESYNKITELRKMIDEGEFNILIEVDGGIDTKNAKHLIESGVNVLVAGNSVFSSENPTETIMKLKQLV